TLVTRTTLFLSLCYTSRWVVAEHNGIHLFCCYFFLYLYDNNRYLHSFPTRRSSDLAPIRWRSCAHARLPMRSLAGIWRRCLTPRDRKSTRLNSSHVKISYAVFCLKKKKSKLTRM